MLIFSWCCNNFNENSVCWLWKDALSNWSIMCHCTLKCQSLQCWDSCSHLLREVVHRHHQERSKSRLKLFSADAQQCSGNKCYLCSSYIINQWSLKFIIDPFTWWQVTFLKTCGHFFGFQSLFLINSAISEASCAVVPYSRNMSTPGRIILKIL